MSEIEIRCQDDRLLAANWVRSTSNSPTMATLVVHSAGGVRRRYYRAFAQYLSNHGVDVLLWDARGIGDSAMQAARSDSATMRDWGQYDQQAVLQHIRTTRYAPPGCVRSLLQRYRRASIEHHEIPAAEGVDGRIGHFGFFKAHNAELWSRVIQWLHVRGFCSELQN